MLYVAITCVGVVVGFLLGVGLSRRDRFIKCEKNDFSAGVLQILVQRKNGSRRWIVIDVEKTGMSTEYSERRSQMNRFVDLKNGIIRDTKTGLEWQAEPLRFAPWQEQMEAAARLNLGGHTDWRLPTIEELVMLIDYSKCNPASEFPRMWPCYCWASSRAASASGAWYVDFYNGRVSDDDKDGYHYTRCVRSAALRGEEVPE